jgi:hypothetical protein
MRIAIPVAILLLLSLPFGLSTPFPHAAFAAEQRQSATVVVDGACGEAHSIFYTITGGAIVSEIKADPAVLTLTASLTESNNGTSEGAANNGTLTITMPQRLIHDENGGRYPEPVVFIDEVSVVYDIQNITEDDITVDIDFPAGAKSIEIIGANILAFTPYTNILTMDIEGREFPVHTFSAPICSYEFSTEQKKLTIHSDNAAEFTVTLRKEMLGGPYSIFLDGKHQVHGVDYSPRYYDNNPANENVTTISVSMLPDRADTIEIVGTTAIPEFASSLSIVGAGVAIALSSMIIVAAKRNSAYKK